MNRIRAQREWRLREIAELHRLRAAGVSYADIATALNRTMRAIYTAVCIFEAPGAKRPVRTTDVQWVRDLAARGYSDRVIGLTVGRTRTSVSQIREREGIASGRSVKTAWRAAA